MTRIEDRDPLRIKTPFGHVDRSLSKLVVGDRLVPEKMEVVFPGAGGQPRLEALIEVLDGVPRLTEWQLVRAPEGREIRQKDLRKIEVDQLVETITALCSLRIESTDAATGEVVAVMEGEQAMRDTARIVAKARTGSRRPMTDARKKQVADLYNAQESGGIEAVEMGFEVSRSTAIRYINAARDAGLIEGRAK